MHTHMFTHIHTYVHTRRSRRLQRPLSHGAAAHIHHLVRVRESKEGGLPSARVGKEGLKRSFLASIGDQLQAHGVVKVSG